MQKELTEELEEKIGLRLKPEDLEDFDYNDWLDAFRKVPAAKILAMEEWLKANLPSEAYAAVVRWVEIFDNPHRIDKLLQSKLNNDETENLLELATGDDDEAFYVALVKKTARELEEAATSQEVARLSMNLKIFKSELSNIRSKTAKKGTLVEKIFMSTAEPGGLAGLNKSQLNAARATKAKKTTKSSTKTRKTTKITKKAPKTATKKTSKTVES